MRVCSPENRPERITDRTAWTAADFPSPDSYRRPLMRDVIAELESAARAAIASGIPPHQVELQDVKLPLTAKMLEAAYDDVERGAGFTVLSGLPVDDWGLELSRIALCLIGSRFGDISLQNREGEYIVDVMDKSTPLSSQFRGYHSADKLDFHNDGCNVVALLCIETAKAGGDSLLLSASTLYNEVSRRRPDLMPALMRGFRHSRRNQREAHQAPVMEDATPVFSFIDGTFHNCYSHISIVASLDQGETHSPEQKEALAVLEQAMEQPGLVLSMEFRKGDVQLVNNFTLLHSRTAFIDHSPERRRHLLRLWLTDPASKYNGPGKMDFYMPQHSRFLKTRGYGIFSS
ncbi:MAG: TauD/TfdA family dioxygenase [Hyphomicrobiaceae bacterium]